MTTEALMSMQTELVVMPQMFQVHEAFALPFVMTLPRDGSMDVSQHALMRQTANGMPQHCRAWTTVTHLCSDAKSGPS